MSPRFYLKEQQDIFQVLEEGNFAIRTQEQRNKTNVGPEFIHTGGYYKEQTKMFLVISVGLELELIPTHMVQEPCPCGDLDGDAPLIVPRRSPLALALLAFGSWRSRSVRVGPRDCRELPLSAGIGPSGAGEQRANGFGG